MTRRRPRVDFYHLFDEDDLFGFAKLTPAIMERVEFTVQLGGRSLHDLQLGSRSLHDLQIGSRAQFEVQH